MKTLIITFILCCTLKSYNQTNIYGTVNYVSNHKKDDYQNVHYALTFGDGFSAFLMTGQDTSQTVRTPEYDDEIIIRKKYPDSLYSKYFLDVAASRMYAVEPVSEDDFETFDLYYVAESAKLDWKIQHEFRQIDSYTCQKALLEFRGRSYTAWFAKDVTVPYGPFKFNGLPGLILSIEDNLKEVSFKATSVKLSTKKNNAKQLFNDWVKQKEAITIESFFSIKNRAREKSSNQFRSVLLSKLPRGATVKVSNQTDVSIELKL
ncbi:MAG: GLPGLI family protein [Saprospiraceae bacterium]